MPSDPSSFAANYGVRRAKFTYMSLIAGTSEISDRRVSLPI